MFSIQKLHLATKISLASIILLLIGCGQGDPSQPVQIPHKELLANFDNNAAACYSPAVQGDLIKCSAIARFAHYTMTFTEVSKSGDAYLKTQYKLRFGEKNGHSCLDHSSIDPEKIRIYRSVDNFGEQHDEDVEENAQAIVNPIKDAILKREKPLGEKCFDYYMFESAEPNLKYQFNQIEIINGTQSKNIEKFAFFSNGTKLVMGQ